MNTNIQIEDSAFPLCNNHESEKTEEEEKQSTSPTEPCGGAKRKRNEEKEKGKQCKKKKNDGESHETITTYDKSRIIQTRASLKEETPPQSPSERGGGEGGGEKHCSSENLPMRHQSCHKYEVLRRRYNRLCHDYQHLRYRYKNERTLCRCNDDCLVEQRVYCDEKSSELKQSFADNIGGDVEKRGHSCCRHGVDDGLLYAMEQ